MRFFVDNNLSPGLAKGMKGFGEDIVHLQDYFSTDADDELWLAHIGTKKWILITRDDRIRFRLSELAALREHRVGAFFMGGKHRDGCQLVQQLARNWLRMKDLADKTRKAFAFRIPPSGKKLKPLTLG